MPSTSTTVQWFSNRWTCAGRYMLPLYPMWCHFWPAWVWNGILCHRATSSGYIWYSHFQCHTLSVLKAHMIVVSVHSMEPVHYHNWMTLLVQLPWPLQRNVVVVLLVCHLVAPLHSLLLFLLYHQESERDLLSSLSSTPYGNSSLAMPLTSTTVHDSPKDGHVWEDDLSYASTASVLHNATSNRWGLMQNGSPIYCIVFGDGDCQCLQEWVSSWNSTGSRSLWRDSNLSLWQSRRDRGNGWESEGGSDTDDEFFAKNPSSGLTKWTHTWVSD